MYSADVYLMHVETVVNDVVTAVNVQLAQLSDVASFSALLRRADLCCERLQPVIQQLKAEDEVASHRFPFHRKRTMDGGLSADDELVSAATPVLAVEASRAAASSPGTTADTPPVQTG